MSQPTNRSVSGDKDELDRLFARAKRVLPGGVSSPVRAFGAVGGTPITFRRGVGATLTDEIGREFLDFVGSWGPLILGHAHREVVEAVANQLPKGTTYGAPHRAEIELAERIVDWYPGADQVRFVSSGTEAVMSATRLARGATGRHRIVKFQGCYHGHVDHLMVQAGSGLVTFGEPSSDGVPEPFASLTHVLPLDDIEAFETLMAEIGEDVAAVIIEPVPANNGLLLQSKAFLTALRAETQRYGALLVFDEVISGFRLARGGAAEIYEITPDLATFGKVIGGGFPVGAFSGPRDIMRHLSPEGSVYQAGTLSGNPVAMTAGCTTLSLLEELDVWSALETLGRHLDSRMHDLAQRSAAPMTYQRTGSLFWFCLQVGDAPRASGEITPASAERYRVVFQALLEQGIYLAPSAYEVGFLSLAHTSRDVDRLVDALGPAVARSGAVGGSVSW